MSDTTNALAKRSKHCALSSERRSMQMLKLAPKRWRPNRRKTAALRKKVAAATTRDQSARPPARPTTANKPKSPNCVMMSPRP